jgi:predicted GNAT family N-acyltransferase
LAEQENKPHFYFEPLGNQHDRAAFSCGIPALDNYLKTQARQDCEKKLAAVFILTPDGKSVSGYYTLSQYSIELDEVPESIAKKLTRQPLVPATLIGRLARTNALEGQRIGERLLMDALYRSLLNSQQVASWAVVVDAKDERAVTFYEHFGFIRLPKVPKRLFLPMKTIEKMFEAKENQ